MSQQRDTHQDDNYLVLPLHTKISEEDALRVCETIKEGSASMFGNSPPLIVTQACEPKQPVPRLSKLLDWLGIACSSWHARPAAEPGRPGRKPKGVPEKLAARIRTLAETYPWWGYKRIAVVAGREGLEVTNKQVYRVICTAGSSLPSNCWISCARAVASKSDLFGIFHLPEDTSSITLHRVQRNRAIQIQ